MQVPRALRPRRSVPAVVGIALLGLLAGLAPSRAPVPKSLAAGDAGAGGGIGAGAAGPDGTGAAGGPGGPAGAGAVAGPGAGAGTTGATLVQGKTVGGVPPRTGTSPTGGTATGTTPSAQGVTDKDVTILYAWQHETCGQDPSAYLNQLGPPGDPDSSIKAAVEYFNKHSLAVFGPELSAAQRDALGSTGYYGRQLKPVIVDDHGQFCAEQARADARQAADSYKPFASIGGADTEGDDEMTPRGIGRVPMKPALDKYFQSRAPYLWGPITGASTINRFLAGYTGAFLKSTPTKDTGNAATAGKPRVFGVIYQDDPDTTDDINDMKAELKKVGVTITKAAAYEPNLGTIGSQATSIVLQMEQAGVNSIFMVMDPIAVEFITQAADSQKYFPEWVSSTYGLFDNSAGPRTFMSAAQASNTFGISVFLPSRQVPAEQAEYWLAWKADHPDSDPPSDFKEWYDQTKVVARGIAMAGRALTPAAFVSGLNQGCHPCTRGEVHNPLIDYGPNHFTGVADAHRQHYDVNEPDYTVPKSQWQ